MTRSQRLALIVAAVALLVGGFLVAQGGDGDTVTTAPGTPAVTASAPETTSTEAATTAAPTTTPAPPKPPAPPTVLVSGGQPEGGVKDLRFDKGEEVRFVVRSDVADEIHVHGYDVSKDVKAGGRVTFAFEGDIDGIFEVELEGAGVQIASLRVSP